MTQKTLKINCRTNLTTGMLIELQDIMSNQETSDREENTTIEYSGEYGTYEIKFDKEGNAILLKVTE